MIDAMVSLLEVRGGKIHCDASVIGIRTQGGRAVGIELKDGKYVSAGKAVIANVSPRNLNALTGDTSNQRYDKRLKAFKHAPGTMMIHLAMDNLPKWRCPELKRFAYVHLAPTLSQMSKTYNEALSGLLPVEPVIVCGQPTVIDPSRAPVGKHVLWLQVRMVPSVISGDAKSEIHVTDWADAARPFADRALDILENYAPGTRDYIIAQHVVTPQMLDMVVLIL